MFEPRVAAASLSGEADAAWARAAAPHVGCAFLGGVALDEATRTAARKLVGRDREEFLPADPVAFVDDQLDALADVDLRPAVNARSRTVGPVAEAGAVCAAHGAVLEVNAHCRQIEMCDAGAGEALLRDPDRLADQIAAADNAGATVSVKVRTEVDGVNLSAVAETAVDAGADIVHVDAMDSEPVVGEVREAVPEAFLVANNGVRGRETARQYLELGADAVSVGRPSDDPRVLRRVDRAVEEFFDSREVSADA